MSQKPGLGKAAIWAVVGIAAIGLTFYLFTRGSSVKGKVTLDGTPIAAGKITFRSSSDEWSSPIESGNYSISAKKLAGEYDVRIHVHFVHAEDAGDFYANVTKELNRNPPGSQDPASSSANSASSEKSLKSIDAYSFTETLTNGSNRRDFQLDGNR